MRAICGGGRYDKLADTLTNNEVSLPAVGFGFGDAVIYELLQMKSLFPMLPSSKEESSHIAIFSPLISMHSDVTAKQKEINLALKKKAIMLADQYRSAGTDKGIECYMNTERSTIGVPPVSKQLKQFLKKASKNGTRYVLLCSEEEHLNGRFVVKDMLLSKQRFVDDNDCKWVQNLIEGKMFE